MNRTLLAQLEKKIGKLRTPFYAYDPQWIASQADKLLEALPKQARAGVRYAVKANSNLSILKIISNKKIGADVVSGGELEKALAAGFASDRIVFSGVGKTRDELEYAIQQNIDSIQIESVSELHQILELARRKSAHPARNTPIKSPINAPISVGLRLNPNLKVDTHKHIHTSDRFSKFGMDAPAFKESLQILAREPKLKLKGLSAHIGSQITDLRSFSMLFDWMRETAKQAEAQSGLELSYVSVGGGLGVSYRENEKPPTLKQYGAALSKAFKQCPWNLYLEPGRILVAPAGVLVSRVVQQKVQNRKPILVLDAGMNDLMRPALYGAHHQIESLRHSNVTRTELKKFKVVGPVCESTDVFSGNMALPSDMQVGDIVLIHNAGAYGFSMASQYNLRTLPAEYFIEDNSLRLVRRPGVISDLWKDEISL